MGFLTEQATGNGTQQLFSLSGTPLAGSLYVTINGQIQEPGTQADYTLSGATVSFAVPSIPKDRARISFRYAVASGSGIPNNVTFVADAASGNGVQTAFDLTASPLAGSLNVILNGQIQEPGGGADYTLIGKTVTFASGFIPANGSRISFRYGVSSGGQILMSQLPGGIANGLATLDADGKIPASQLAATTAGIGSGSQTVITTGITSWTVPPGVTRVFAQVWGGGAGGFSGNGLGGNGGAGGGYVDGWCPVTPGAAVAVAVGAGGSGGINGAGGNGGDSSFGNCLAATGAGWGSDGAILIGKNPTLWDGMFLRADGALLLYLYAKWGSDTNLIYPTRSDTGGFGGAAMGVNDHVGYYGSPSINGGGGGASGARSNTTLAIAVAPGGTSSKGGVGGNGAGSPYSSLPCTAGGAPGGGGGGGSYDGIAFNPGCDGGRGQVNIWW